jgi:very-short-patch-repair endonuclease
LDRNIQFEKQYPIPQEKRDSMGRQRYYFLDFAITNLKIAIECDGKYYHQDLKKDEIRQKYIENLGWTFVRFDNKEIRGNVTKCVNKIEEILKCQN